MNPATLELALRKLRLQIASDGLRRDFARHATGLAPVFAGADYAVESSQLLRRHPQVLGAAGVALLVARPRRVWQWARRAFVGWQLWRKAHELLEQRRPA